MEHTRPSRRQKTRVPEALQEVIQGIVDWSEDSDGKGWKEFQLSIWKCFAAYIEEDSVHVSIVTIVVNFTLHA